MVPHARARVEHLGGRGVRILSSCSAGKKKVDQIGNQQEPICLWRDALVCMGPKLKQCIERQELSPGAAKNLFARNVREDLFPDALGSLVAITDWQLDQVALCIDQSVINSPAINANALNRPIKFAGTGCGLA